MCSDGGRFVGYFFVFWGNRVVVVGFTKNFSLRSHGAYRPERIILDSGTVFVMILELWKLLGDIINACHFFETTKNHLKMYGFTL